MATLFPHGNGLVNRENNATLVSVGRQKGGGGLWWLESPVGVVVQSEGLWKPGMGCMTKKNTSQTDPFRQGLTSVLGAKL